MYYQGIDEIIERQEFEKRVEREGDDRFDSLFKKATKAFNKNKELKSIDYRVIPWEMRLFYGKYLNTSIRNYIERKYDKYNYRNEIKTVFFRDDKNGKIGHLYIKFIKLN